MDSDIFATIFALIILIIMSAFFSATETSFTSMNRIRIKNMAEKGDKKSLLVLTLSEDYGRLLSTILVGNNIVNIAATSIATVLFVSLFGTIGPTISTIVMTVVVLIFGEISPKTLANEFPEKFARFAAPILKIIMIILKPINFLFAKWKKLLEYFFTFDKSNITITEEELLTIVDEAKNEGAIEEDDKDLILNVIEFNDSDVKSILTPRVDLVGIDINADIEEIINCFIETGYSRLPIYAGDIDHIIGVLHLRDFFEYMQRPVGKLDEIISPVEIITPFLKISEVLKRFQSEKTHMAVVIDEYGGTMGIITMEDILEELVGEIWDEYDEIIEDTIQESDNRWKVSGNAEIEDVLDTIGIDYDEDFNRISVSGWVMNSLEHIPVEGEEFIFDNILKVTIVEMNKNRVVTCIFENIIDSI